MHSRDDSHVRTLAGWARGVAVSTLFAGLVCLGRGGGTLPTAAGPVAARASTVATNESLPSATSLVPPMLIGITNFSAWSHETPTGDRSAVWVSPTLMLPGPWTELIVSWNVQPAAGAGLTVEAQAVRAGGERTKFYTLGEWSLGADAPGKRTSVRGQRDADGTVKTDTLVLAREAEGVRFRVRLRGALEQAPERLRFLGISACDARVAPVAESGRPARREVWGRTLEVPERSQLASPAGEGWCSPTCVSMVLAWWARVLNRPELDRPVPDVAAGVEDPAWPGTGNWPFNTAYAGSFEGMIGCAGRLADLRAVEDLVEAGIPVVLSVYPGALRGKPVALEAGHLIVCIGFTATGDVVANDPYARLAEGQPVRRVYARANVERAWSHARRLAYLIAPDTLRGTLPMEWR